MKYFKDDQNKVHALEDASFAHLLPNGCVEITEAEAIEIQNPPETPEQVIARLESAIDQHLDFVAKSYRYESIRTMVTYATSAHPTFGPEGRAAVKFRDACYAKAFEIQDDVAAGTREVPTEAELIAEMPLFSEFLNYE